MSRADGLWWLQDDDDDEGSKDLAAPAVDADEVSPESSASGLRGVAIQAEPPAREQLAPPSRLISLLKSPDGRRGSVGSALDDRQMPRPVRTTPAVPPTSAGAKNLAKIQRQAAAASQPSIPLGAGASALPPPSRVHNKRIRLTSKYPEGPIRCTSRARLPRAVACA